MATPMDLTSEEIAARRQELLRCAAERKAKREESTVQVAPITITTPPPIPTRQPRLQAIGDWLRDCYYRFCEWRRMAELEAQWRARGHPMPAMAAAEEMGHRIALEKFREFASMRYLEDQTLTPRAIKQEYFSWVSDDTFKSLPGCRSDLEIQMAAVEAMTDVFIGQAKAAYEARLSEQFQQNQIWLKESRKHRPSYEVRARRGWA
jgi:hypothetical protein